MKAFIRVEYDPEYCGGNYTKVGKFVNVPSEAAHDIESAFEKQTGLPRDCIVFYTTDEYFDENGDYIP